MADADIPTEKPYKSIPLNQGYEAIVDAEDYDWLMQWPWHLAHNNCGQLYAGRNKHVKKHNKCKRGRMHRIIMNAPSGVKVDHWNGNGLDNRKDNLRLCNNPQNNQNANKRKVKTTSKYKGVYWSVRNKKWATQIVVDKKWLWLGQYKTEDEAAIAYNEAAKKYFGEFARLNEV